MFGSCGGMWEFCSEITLLFLQRRAVSMIWIINVITPTVKCEMSSRFSSLSSENDLMLYSKKKTTRKAWIKIFLFLKIWIESIRHSNSSIQYRIIEVYINIVSDIDFPAWLVGLKWTKFKNGFLFLFSLGLRLWATWHRGRGMSGTQDPRLNWNRIENLKFKIKLFVRSGECQQFFPK